MGGIFNDFSTARSGLRTWRMKRRTIQNKPETLESLTIEQMYLRPYRYGGKTMTEIRTTKADINRAIDTERDWWRAVLDLATQDGPLTGDEAIDGNWTVKELLAHVNGWRGWTVARLEAAADGDGKPVPPWPAGMSDTTEKGTDEINAWFGEQSRAESLETLVERLNGQLDALDAVVERMPAEDLLTPGRFTSSDPGLRDLPIGPALIGFSIVHVHEEHAPALEAWLTARLGQHAELPPTPSSFGYEY